MNEQRTFWAAIVTIVMWVALTMISLVFMMEMTTNALGAGVFVIIMAGMAIGGTAVIWDNVGRQPAVQASSSKQRRKAKREQRARAAQLVEDLDADQLIELETLLLAGQDDLLDGERLR
ncbi:hypothetical protein ACFLYO_02595 [Chloroflexota bacterium]